MSEPDLLNRSWVTLWLESMSPDQTNASRNLKQFLNDIEKYQNVSESFLMYTEEKAENIKTWKLWKQYILEDGFAYICIHSIIRTGNWNLKIAALKGIAALFSAFDWPKYQKLTLHM